MLIHALLNGRGEKDAYEMEKIGISNSWLAGGTGGCGYNSLGTNPFGVQCAKNPDITFESLYEKYKGQIPIPAVRGRPKIPEEQTNRQRPVWRTQGTSITASSLR